MNRPRLLVAAAQGLWLRATVKPAPPATGLDHGTAAAGSPEQPGPALRVTVLGDSTAAGCGVATHDDGYPGWLARGLADRTGRAVEWRAVGQFGATASRVRHRLLPQVGDGLDAVVLLAGANDVLSRRAPAAWREDLTAILDGLADRTRQVVVVGIPPFRHFPTIPATLGRYLTESSAALDAVSREVCKPRPGVHWITIEDTPGPDFFSPDRFHPSGAGYRVWAAAAVDRLAAEGLSVGA